MNVQHTHQAKSHDQEIRAKNRASLALGKCQDNQ